MQIGAVLANKFRIERELGRGGMGVVVVATHLQLEQLVALKFLHEDITWQPEVVERLLREARASAKLKSEHACRIMDVGTLDTGAPYIVMELLEGHDLSAVARAAPLSPAIAAEYVLQACVAIAEAHAAGIIHRDLKPSNLFLTERLDGTPLVKVLDFGIAKATSKVAMDITRTTTIMGSPGYMSPEQLRSSKVVDARTDIWALGVILYELVTGRVPFRADTITELAVKVAMDEPEPLVTDPAYAAVVMRCLEKSVDRRYPDVAALAADLARVAGPRGLASTSMISRLLRSSAIARAVDPPAGASSGMMPTQLPEPAATAETREVPQRAVAVPPLVAPPSTTLQAAAGIREPGARKSSRVPVLILAGGILVGTLAVVLALRFTSRDAAVDEPARQPVTVDGAVAQAMRPDAAVTVESVAVAESIDAGVARSFVPADGGIVAVLVADAGADAIVTSDLVGSAWTGQYSKDGKSDSFTLTLKDNGRAVFYEIVEPAPFLGTWSLRNKRLSIVVSQRGPMPDDASKNFFDKWVLAATVAKRDEIKGQMINYWDDAPADGPLPGGDLTAITTTYFVLKRTK